MTMYMHACAWSNVRCAEVRQSQMIAAGGPCVSAAGCQCGGAQHTRLAEGLALWAGHVFGSLDHA